MDSVRTQKDPDITSEINNMRSEREKQRLLSDKGSFFGSATELQYRIKE